MRLAAEHKDAYERRCREVAWEWRMRTLGPLLHTAWILAVALACVLAFSASDCGNVEAEPAPDASAFELAARMRAWQPTWAGNAGELESVAQGIVAACRRDPWPSAERCPGLLAVLAFRESSWRPGAIGARGEVGLVQLHGAALAGETREAAADPDANLRLGLAWLKRSAFMCRLAGRDTVEAALSMYGSGRCRVYRGASLLLRWEREIATMRERGER